MTPGRPRDFFGWLEKRKSEIQSTMIPQCHADVKMGGKVGDLKEVTAVSADSLYEYQDLSPTIPRN